LGIISNMKAGIKLAKLKKQVSKEATPATIGELARYYIHSGDNSSAYLLINKGLKLFPDSEILMSFWNYLKKSQDSGKIRSAIEALDNDPAPENFITVIDAYRGIKDLDSQVEYCRKFINHFPDSVDAHRCLGKIRFDRFLRDYSSIDGNAALVSLEKAIELDPNDIPSLLLLARLYLYCGLSSKSDPILKHILEEDPEHDIAMELQDLLRNAPQEEEDIVFRFSKIEEMKRFYLTDIEENNDSDSELTDEDISAVEQVMAKALNIKGVETAVFLSNDQKRFGCGQVDTEADEPDPDHDWSPFSQFADRITNAARKASLRMDIGSFEQGIIEGADGGCVIRKTKEGTIAFCLNHGNVDKKALSSLRDLSEEINLISGKNDE